MNNSLKKELSVVAAAAAFLAYRQSKSKVLPAFLGSIAGALYLSSLKKNFSFKNKAVYITGGSRGLGLSIAWNLLKQGARVTLVARDAKELERGEKILLGYFPDGEVYTSVCDVTVPAELHASLDKAIDQMDGIDVLINNAGSIMVGPFETMKQEDFEAQMKLHLYAVIESVRYITKHFEELGGGRILNICSLGGKVAVPHMLPYDASKFALAGFSQGVAAELAPHNIVVTTAYPTVMRTGSPIQAVFKGDHEKEFEWFQSIDNMPVLSMSADTAAKKVLRAVADARTEVILSMPARARMLMGAFVPETMNAVMALAARVLPSGTSTLRKTGADSSSAFNRNPFLKSFKKTAKKEEKVYNQSPKHNAKQNMGLN